MKKIIFIICIMLLYRCEPVNACNLSCSGIEQVKNIELYTEEERLLAKLIIAEAENQSELGQRLVACTVLNRVDNGFGDSIKEVVFAKNQFSCISDGRYEECKITKSSLIIARSEMRSRTNDEVLYFRTNHYHSWGTPIFQEDDHYFSK